jgi:hypothetical protein
MENTEQNATTANTMQGTRRRENGTPNLLLCCCGQMSSRRIQRQNRNIELEIEGGR